MFESEDCTEHSITFCGYIRTEIVRRQLLYKRERKRYLTVQRAVDQIFREWKELKDLNQHVEQ